VAATRGQKIGGGAKQKSKVKTNNTNSNSGSNGSASLDFVEEEQKEVNHQLGSMDEKSEKEERAHLLTYLLTS
jgi:hypothetical protein